MNNNEAVEILQNIGKVYRQFTEKEIEAINIAIKQVLILDKIEKEIKELDDKVCQQFLIEDIDKEVHHTYQKCLKIIQHERNRE